MTNEVNHISEKFLEGSDLREREKEVLVDACNKLGFTPTELLSRSAWWGSKEIGAFHYLGTYEGKPAVIKIQGIKPDRSEADMIKAFEKANKSKIIRPPHLYGHLLWDDQSRFEALVLEHVVSSNVVGIPATTEQLDKFFSLYKEYKENCVQSPWVEKPKRGPEAIRVSFEKWRQISFKQYPTHPLRKDEDAALIDQAVDAVVKGYRGVEPTFQHGHFSFRDLFVVGDEVVILSNLYWSWRSPFYDGVFGYHWYMYSLENMTIEQVEEQRTLWLERIYGLASSGEDTRLIKLALLERAAAGLNLDALVMDPKKETAKHLVEETREQIKSLMKDLT